MNARLRTIQRFSTVTNFIVGFGRTEIKVVIITGAWFV